MLNCPLLTLTLALGLLGGASAAEMMNARVRFEPTDDVRLSERSVCLATDIRQESGDWLVIEPGEFTVFQPSNGKSNVYAADDSVSGQTVTWMKELGWSFSVREAGTYDVWMRARFPLAANYNHAEKMDDGAAATISDSADGRRVDKFAATSMFTVQDAWLQPKHWHWFKSKSYELAAGRHFFHWPANGAWNGGCELDRIVLVRRGSAVKAEDAGLANRTVVRAKTGELVSRRIRLAGVRSWSFDAALKPGDGQATVEYAYRPDAWQPLAVGTVQTVPAGADYLYLRLRLVAAAKGLQPLVDNFRFRVEKAAQAGDSADDPPAPSAAQLAYFKTGVMGIIHYGLNTYVDREWGYGDTPPSVFNPTKLDAEQWVVAAKRGGLKRLILVTKHHDGFCLFPSKLNADYTIANTPWKDGKGDLVREVRDACTKHGIAFGAYLSPWDRHQANYATPAYVDYFQGQWDELLANYGPIVENWLDGANGGDGWYGGAKEKRKLPCAAREYYRFDDLLVKLVAHDPMAVSFGGGLTGNCVKWIGNEKGMNDETRWNDESGAFVPYEADTPFRKRGWFWHADDKAKSLAELVEVYFLSVGRGAVLDLGLAPNRDGLLDEGDVKRLAEFGDWVRQYEATDCTVGARRTEERKGLTLSVTLDLSAPATFNALDFGEDLSHGQQIAAWTLETFADGSWRDLVTGTTAGFRRMERFPETTAAKVRLTCRGRTRAPTLSSFALRVAAAVPEEREADPFEQWRSPCKVTETVPGTLEFDFLRKVSVNAIQYIPAKNRVVGVPDQYEISMSDDGKTWRTVLAGEFGNLRANPVLQRQRLPEPKTMRYARVKATRALEGAPTWKDALFEFFTME